MTTNVVKKPTNLAGLFLLLMTFISCVEDTQTIGVDLIDNHTFSTGSFVSEVAADNLDIDRVPANNILQYLLGVYTDEEFGSLEASFATQLVLPALTDGFDYGTNSVIDSVLVTIPYQSTNEGTDSEGKPTFSIDSVFGNPEVAFQLEVYELKTFLNTLDPNNPSQPAVYYSDKEFQKGTTPLYSGDFKVNPNDTVTYVKRYLADGLTVYDIDTLKRTDLSPSIKLPLDENTIQQLFIDPASGTEFSSQDDFSHYFRGLYFKASSQVDNQSHLVSLALADAKLTIYFSNDQDEEAEEDLNGNGENGEQGVRVKNQYSFSFGSLKSSVYERDYSVSKQSGADRLYIQGAAGEMATINLFPSEDLDLLRENNWLITEANLTLYVDQQASSNIAPERLFIYNHDEQLHVRDMFTEGGLSAIGGSLELDDDGHPYKYVFKITDYVSEVLKPNSTESLTTLGIRTYNPTDLPTDQNDVFVDEVNWNPKGVVLFDENAGENKISLEIHYTELNN
ncbi:MAG: DUF4270 domain-containing protein [Lutibacter sp.]|jgi:hypothetical protein|nr:DUF4270 domain-containing protein [Lutibacter sp.]